MVTMAWRPASLQLNKWFQCMHALVALAAQLLCEKRVSALQSMSAHMPSVLTCRSRVACAEEVGALIEREGPRVYSGAGKSQHSTKHLLVACSLPAC
jgi:hypothetical protein